MHQTYIVIWMVYLQILYLLLRNFWGNHSRIIGRQDPPPFILTAVPRKSDTRGVIAERAAEDKKRWMRKHFGVKDARVFAVLRKHKANFAKDGRDGRPNLLIDDHIKNVDAFRKKGGIGVHHTSAQNTIKELRKLGYE